MNPYTASLIVLMAALFVATAGMAVDVITDPFRSDKVKNASYECDCDPTSNHGNQARFPVKYYLAAVMSIILDIEMAFLYPWAVFLMGQGKFGMLVMMPFVELSAMPFIYVWARRGSD